jgi:hypothetical protein
MITLSITISIPTSIPISIDIRARVASYTALLLEGVNWSNLEMEMEMEMVDEEIAQLLAMHHDNSIPL